MERSNINIDFRNLQYMDASVAGVLAISNVSSGVLQVLNRANLGKLRTIR